MMSKLTNILKHSALLYKGELSVAYLKYILIKALNINLYNRVAKCLLQTMSLIIVLRWQDVVNLNNCFFKSKHIGKYMILDFIIQANGFHKN